jgi:toxin ParE1/3/4
MDDRYEVKVTGHAEAAMREIARYIAFELLAPEAAVNLLVVLQQEMEKLAYMPGRVHLTPEEPWHSEGIHRLPVKNFYVYFWIDEDRKKVQVIDVIYIKRDQQRQLMNMPLEDE